MILFFLFNCIFIKILGYLLLFKSSVFLIFGQIPFACKIKQPVKDIYNVRVKHKNIKRSQKL